MAFVAEALWLGHGFVNEMALTNGKAIPGIDLDRQHLDQCFDQPGPERDTRSSSNSPPAAEAGHCFIHADGLLSHHNSAHSSLAGLRVALMGMGGEIAANRSDVCCVDEVEAGIPISGNNVAPNPSQATYQILTRSRNIGREPPDL